MNKPINKLILVALLYTVSTSVMAQHGYLQETIYLNDRFINDSANWRLIRQNTPMLATLLVEGYLNNKIKGYRFSYEEKVLEYAPLPKELWPPAWSSKEYYFNGDNVSYKGYGFSMTKETRPSPIPPDKSDDWWRFELLGHPIKIHVAFPTLKDTLPKSEFLKRMVIQEESKHPKKWDSLEFYSPGDFVLNLGSCYKALDYVEPRTKLTDENYWWAQGKTLPYSFNNLGYVYSVEMLYYFQVAPGTDTTWIPQSLQLEIENPVSGLPTKLITFAYCDIVNYLGSVSEPMIYRSNFGYAGDSVFILDKIENEQVKQLIVQQIRSQKITGKNLVIVDPSAYEDVLRPTSSAKDYLLVQDLVTNDLQLIKKARTVVKVSAKTFLDVVKIEKPRLYSYAEALHREELVLIPLYKSTPGSYTFSSGLFDSLPPATTHPCAVRRNKAYYWLEEDSLSVSDAHEQDVLREAWHCIVANARQKTISSEPKKSMDALSFDWSKVFVDSLGLDLTDQDWSRILDPPSNDYYDVDFTKILSILYHLQGYP